MISPQGQAVAVEPIHCPGVPSKQEVTFADGSALWLHRVNTDDGRAAPYERRIEQENGEFVRVDLRRLAPDLAYHLPGSSLRDVSSAVFHSLRKRFGSTEQLRAAIGGMVA